jgi:hypothetical protein
MISPTFLGGICSHFEQYSGFIQYRNTIIQYRNTFAATGANLLGLRTQKTRAPLSPGWSNPLKFPAKADLIP